MTDMTLAEFELSEHFQTALDDVKAKNKAELEKKERLKRERERRKVYTVFL